MTIKRPFKDRTLQYFEGKYRMRAIAALLTGFICLAAVQAGYMIVEAHRSHEAMLDKGEHREHMEASHRVQKISMERRRSRKHQNTEEDGDYVGNETADSDGRRNKTMMKADRYESSRHSDHREYIRQSGGHHKGKTHGRKSGKASAHPAPVDVYVPGTERNASGTQQLLQVALKTHEDIVPDAPQMKKVPDAPRVKKVPDPPQVKKVPDAPQDEGVKPTGDALRKSRPSASHKTRVDSSIVRKQGKHLTDEEKEEIRRYHRARWGHKRARKGHKKGHRRCRSQQDCGHGECCLERREGQKYCMPGGTKGAGKHCADECVCKPDLQCFLHDVSRTRFAKEGKIFGKCMDPDMVDMSKGHLIPSVTTSKPRTYMSKPGSTGQPIEE